MLKPLAKATLVAGLILPGASIATSVWVLVLHPQLSLPSPGGRALLLLPHGHRAAQGRHGAPELFRRQ